LGDFVSRRAARSALGHIYRDFFPWTSGCEVIPWLPWLFWPTRLLHRAEGEAAAALINVLEHSPETYPYREKYFLLGPNSNTYAAWAIEEWRRAGFDRARGWSLPKNAIGKNYRR